MKTSVLNHFIIVFALVFSLVKANNINVTNIALVNQNTTAGLNNAANHTFVQFDLTWDNSWRNSAGPANWDAAWVFVKFQVFGSPEWLHATLSSTDANHSITNNNGVSMNIDAAANGRGVMIHRTSNGNGSLNLQGVRLRWDYRSGNVVHDTANVTVRVFAMEMVFVPQGQFFIGDGTLTSPLPSTSAFRINNVGNNRPYLVQNENAWNLISGTATGGGVNDVYDPLVSQATILNASFPKGFSSFYISKYEVTVKQYVDFFNTLRTDIVTAKNNRNLSASQITRNTFTWNASPLTDATTGTTSGDRAQGAMSMNDALAYADWAGLRPMTELEFEKAARGCDRTGASPGIAVYPVNGEFAWGENANANSVTGTANLVNDGTNSEGITSPTTSLLNVNTGFSSGPVRVGIFSAKNASSLQRRQSGSSYYGVMELTGNVEEWMYCVGNQTEYQRTNCSGAANYFDGRHGDGNINSSTGDNNTFSTDTYFGMYARGGSYSSLVSVSNRSGLGGLCASQNYTTRTSARGFRCVVTGSQF